MLSRLNRSTCLLIMSIVLCVSLPGVQARPFTDQASIYLPMVQPRPVLLLSGPAFYEWRYGVITIGEVVNMSATQAFSVTVQAIIYDQNRGITQTQKSSRIFRLSFLDKALRSVWVLSITNHPSYTHCPFTR